MKKSIILPMVFTIYSSAQSLNYALLDRHAFTLQKDSISMGGSILAINDTLDIFNIKESEIGSLSRFGSIGDMSGVDLEFRYGLRDNISLFANYQRWNIDYLDSTLSNNRFEFFSRFNIINRPYTSINALSIDLGFINNQASTISIKSDEALNSMINKIAPNSSKSIEDGNIISGDSIITLFGDNSEKIYPYVNISNLNSNSYYIRAILAKKISQNSLIDIYLGYKLTEITTTISLEPSNNSYLSDAFENYDIPNLDRDESSIEVGFVSTNEHLGYIYEFGYEFNKIFRDSDLNYRDSNHIVEASISKIINRDLLIFIGGRVMFSQFNSDIPYLYNQYTQTQYDKKYGFAKLGLIYSFSL